jgi:hypothetical protein
MVQGTNLLLCGGKDASVATIYDGNRYTDCWRAPISSAGNISWTRVATTAWSARAAYAWAFRPSTGILYIFGGEQKWTSPNRAMLRDVYSTTSASAGASWSLEATMQLPARRCLHSAVVDTVAAEDIYIFAGMTNPGTGGGTYAIRRAQRYEDVRMVGGDLCLLFLDQAHPHSASAGHSVTPLARGDPHSTYAVILGSS